MNELSQSHTNTAQVLDPAAMTPRGDWSKEQLQFLVKNRLLMSMSELAEHLGKTRGSVAGKLFRIGFKVNKAFHSKMVSRALTRAHASGKYAGRKTRRLATPEGLEGYVGIKSTFKRGAKSVPQHMIEPPVMILNGTGVKIGDMEAHHCKWIIGEPSDITCCGQDRQNKSPYCTAHHSIAYKPPLKRA